MRETMQRAADGNPRERAARYPSDVGRLTSHCTCQAIFGSGGGAAALHNVACR